MIEPSIETPTTSASAGSRAIRFVEASIILAAFLVAVSRNLVPLATPVLLILCTVLLRLRRSGWRSMGFVRGNLTAGVVMQALGIGVGIVAVAFLVLIPLAESVTGAPLDLSLFRELHDNLAFLGIMLILAWTYAAFGEEMVFRAFAIRTFQAALGGRPLASFAAIGLSSTAFGVAHGYQGPAGVLVTGFIGVILSVLYVRGGNLWRVVIAHGVVDTVVMLGYYFGILA